MPSRRSILSFLLAELLKSERQGMPIRAGGRRPLAEAHACYCCCREAGGRRIPGRTALFDYYLRMSFVDDTIAEDRVSLFRLML